MSWKNISDEELDGLFKESADRFDPPFDPEAWAAMDQKLDAAQANRARYKRYLPLLLLLVMLSLLTVYKFNLSGSEPQVASNTGDSASAQTDFQKAPSSNSPLSEQKNIDNQTQDEETANQAETRQKTPTSSSRELNKITVADKETKARNSGFQHKRRIVPGGGNKVVSTPVLASFPDSSQETRGGAERSGGEFAASAQPVEDNALAFDKPRGKADSVNKADTATLPTVTPDSLLQAVAETAQDSTTSQNNDPEKKQEPKESYFLKYVQVALAVAPDFTTVKFRDADAVSANGGVLLAVPLTKRFSLVTGAVMANKVYGARPGDYSGAGGYYTGKGELTGIDATCRVLDIPLNLRYQVWANEKNSLAVQTGLSSYIMLSERYTSSYKYDSGYGDYFYKNTWEVKNQNRHWLSVQNVSVVYARSLSNALAVGVEPFAKIPWRGVGAGKVRLTSAGVFFSIGYSLGLKP